MSGSEVSAWLTLGGLAFELIAIIWILVSVGIAARIAADLRRLRRRAWALVLRMWPWANPRPHQEQRGMTDTLTITDSVSTVLRKATDLPAPESLEEVGQRFNDYAKVLNRHEELLASQGEEARHQVQAAKDEAAGRHEQTESRLQNEAAERLVERKREGLLLVFGVALQIAAAIVILA